MNERGVRRRVLGWVCSLLCLLPLSGCLVVSLQPLVEKDAVEVVPGFVGTWVPVDEADGRLVVEEGAWNAYELALTEGKDTMRFTGRFTRLGKALVLDLTTPTGVENPVATVQVHLVARVDLKDEALTLTMLDYDWVSAHLSAPAMAGAAPVLDGEKNVVLTAPTARLRTWLAAHLASPGLWDEPSLYTRKPKA